MDHDHGYNTRSRRNSHTPDAGSGSSGGRNCCPAPNRRRTRSTSRAHRHLCLCNETAFERYFRFARIIIVVGLIIIFIWYNGDRTYNAMRKELDSLSSHINIVEEFLQKATDKKGCVEKRITEIADTLPQIKEMAKTLREDIERCKSRDSSHLPKGAEQLRTIIKEELEKFNADKTGRTDFALESSGGLIMNTRKTLSVAASEPSLSLFGIPICASSNSPKALIQPGVMPGECWAFKGSAGSAVIKLVKPISVTGVSLEHISRNISPTGNANTAPKEFSIWGLENPNELEGFFFGKYEYDVSGPSVQYFPVQHKSSYNFEVIEFRVHSNHGHPEYTCVYRLRVHGDLRCN